MDKKISESQMKTYKRFMTNKDFKAVGESCGYSYSTVNNIVNRRVRVTDSNYICVDALNSLLKKRIHETLVNIAESEVEFNMRLVDRGQFEFIYLIYGEETKKFGDEVFR